MARALNPARQDTLGWYLEGSAVDLSLRLKRSFANTPHELLAERIEELLPGINADAASAANEAMDNGDLQSGSVVSELVENYYLCDAEESLISLVELQLDGDNEPGHQPTLILRGVKGSASFNGDVKAWRVEFDHVPCLFVKDTQGNWIQLRDPMRIYEMEVMKDTLRLFEYLCSIKKDPQASRTLCPKILQAHSELLKKLVARDPDLKAPLEFLSSLKKRKATDDYSSSKRLKEEDEEEEDDEVHEQVGDGMQGDFGEDTELGESICAVCDDGGNLLCCDGPCLRSFHSDCLDILKVPYAHLKQSSFYCRNCSEHQHQCFSCGRLGCSQGSSAEVFLCDVAFCGKFYHRSCVSKLLDDKDVENGFVCPLHTCFKCRKGEEKSQWLYECRRCPRAWHEECADERILFQEREGEKRRGWIIGKTRFLYCMRHSLDANLQTPKRNHLAFPSVRPEIRPRDPVPLQFRQKRVSPTEQRAIEDPVQTIIEDSMRVLTLDTVASKLSRPQTVASAANELCHMNMIRSQVNAANRARVHLANGGSLEDARRICPPFRFKRFKEAMKVYLSPLLYGMRYSTFGRHFTVTEKLQAVVDRLCWYLTPGDMVADLCCGANEFSRLLSAKMAEMKISCRFKNFDVFQPSDTFCFERRDFTTIKATELAEPDKLIIGLNPPFGVNALLASKFAKLAASFSPKLIILIAPKETLRLEPFGYDLVWEDKRLCEGNAFYFPGSVDATGNTISHENHDAPYLFLWSRRDWRVTHERIASLRGHFFGVEECSLDVVTEAFADSGKADQTQTHDCAPEAHHQTHENAPEAVASLHIDRDADELSPQLRDAERSEVVEGGEVKSPGEVESQNREGARGPPQQEGRFHHFPSEPRQQLPPWRGGETSRAASREERREQSLDRLRPHRSSNGRARSQGFGEHHQYDRVRDHRDRHQAGFGEHHPYDRVREQEHHQYDRVREQEAEFGVAGGHVGHEKYFRPHCEEELYYGVHEAPAYYYSDHRYIAPQPPPPLHFYGPPHSHYSSAEFVHQPPPPPLPFYSRHNPPQYRNQEQVRGHGRARHFYR